MTELITREKLEYIARKILHYPLHDAEKDYFLTLAMKLVSQSPLSNKCLVMYPEMTNHNLIEVSFQEKTPLPLIHLF